MTDVREARAAFYNRESRNGKPAPLALPEFRRFAVEGLRIEERAATATPDANGLIRVTGEPIVYNSAYTVADQWGEFEETMQPGVATQVLDAGCDTRFLFNHDGLPLARTLSGTLALLDTSSGLRFAADFDSRQQLANDLAVAIERGDVTQMSCGFVVGDDTWNDAWDQRSIWRFSQLFDVSAVTYPASPTTSIELAQRSLSRMPVESRARTQKLYAISRQIRSGSTISDEDLSSLADVLDILHAIDDQFIPAATEQLIDLNEAVDAGQAAISDVLEVPDPDGDPNDLQPALVSPDDAAVQENSASPAEEDGTRAALELERERAQLRARTSGL